MAVGVLTAGWRDADPILIYWREASGNAVRLMASSADVRPDDPLAGRACDALAEAIAHEIARVADGGSARRDGYVVKGMQAEGERRVVCVWPVSAPASSVPYGVVAIALAPTTLPDATLCDFLDVACGQLASALSTIQADRSSARLEALVALHRRLGLAFDAGAALDALVDAAIGIAGAAGGFGAQLVDGNFEAKRYLTGGTTVPVDFAWPLNHPLPEWLMSRRCPRISNDIGREGLIEPTLAQRLMLKTALSVPLLGHDGTLIGFVQVHNKANDLTFDEEDASLLSAAANAAAIILAYGHTSRRLAELTEKNVQDAQRLQILSRRLIEAQELERRHFARELHDELGQALTAVKLGLEHLRGGLRMSGFAAQLDDSIEIVDRAIGQVRAISLDLRPPMLDELGLLATVRWHLDRQSRRAGIPMHLHAPFDRFQEEPPPGTRTTCFRILQEAVTNVIRHANASSVRVDLSLDDHALTLVVTDDGDGFDVDRSLQRSNAGHSFGLLGMRERAGLLGGSLAIRSAPGKGAEVAARLPLPDLLSERRRQPRP